MITIIAEIGVNWDGDLEIAREMMKSSKDAGCSFVKFQAFNESLVKEHQEKDQLMKSAITPENIKEIDSISKSV